VFWTNPPKTLDSPFCKRPQKPPSIFLEFIGLFTGNNERGNHENENTSLNIPSHATPKNCGKLRGLPGSMDEPEKWGLRCAGL